MMHGQKNIKKSTVTKEFYKFHFNL